ncbi:FitA-like ribbon-helix-helix domain-containing protein [Salana multivorans]
MSTLYIRDVPDETTDALKRRAAAAGKSLTAYLTEELTRLAGQPTSEELLARLRSRDRSSGPTTGDILDALRESRL